MPALLLCAPAGAQDLLTVYSQALGEDPDFQIAQADLNAGLQAAAQGRSGLLPKVSISLNRTDTDREQGGEESSFTRDAASLTASMPLLDAPSWHQASAGSLQAQAAQAEYRQRLQELILKIASLYLEVLRAQDALEAAEALKENTQNQAEQVRLRYSAGLSNINELEEARYGLDNAQAVYLGADSNLQTARLALSAVTNRPVENIHRLDRNFTEWPPDLSPAELVALSLKGNHELKALRLQSASVRAQARGAASEHLPKLSLNLSQTETETDEYDDLPATFGSVLPSKSTDTRLSLSLNLPLYTGGGLSAQRRQLAARAESMEQRVQLTTRNLRQQMLSLHSRIVNSVATIRANRQALRSAMSAEEATRIRYRAGTRNTLDVSTASSLTHDARRRYQDGIYDHILLRLQLEQAIGDLGIEDLEMINAWLQPPAS